MARGKKGKAGMRQKEEKRKEEDEEVVERMKKLNVEKNEEDEQKQQQVDEVSRRQETTQVEDDNRGEGNAEEEKKVQNRVKRARTSKREEETEYFPDKRNLEDLWKKVFPVGTEWDQLDSVYQYNWNFSNLEDAFEDEGELHGKRVYLFSSTEPQMVTFKEQQKIICIPVVVAVVSPFPPSDKIGINSVQRETEEIIPMKRMKMDWVPYIPLENRGSRVERLKSEIFILRCTQRKSALKHLKEERVKKFEYCLPYFYQPLKEDELEQSTIVQILYPIDPKPVFCEYDWEFDEFEEFTDKLTEADELSADQKDAFMGFLKEKVWEAKKANREAREARKKALAEMSSETKAAYENIKFYKFYPVSTPDSPDVSNVKVILFHCHFLTYILKISTF
ncbi:Protein HEAT INTOLERANT 4, variant 4 [Dionaea muscipula]